MPATLFSEPNAAYVSVADHLPTEFDADGWSTAKLVCTAGRVNIFPHCFIAPRKGRPGYWLQVGAPHAVTTVTHWREYPEGPTLAIVLPLALASDAS